MPAIVVMAAALALPPTAPPTPDGWPLGTMTPYWMHETPPAVPPTEGAAGVTCEPVQVQQVGRHGSRDRKAADLDGVQRMLAERGAAIGNPALAFLKSWTHDFSPVTDNCLNRFGEEEWYQAGLRAQAAYNATLFAGGFSPTYHPVRTTYKSRTARSASSFFAGAMEGAGALGACRVDPVAMYSVFSGNTDQDGDVELRFFDNCPAYAARVKHNATHAAYAEPAAYLRVNITSEMLPRMAARLQLDGRVWRLTAADAKSLWQACQVEAAARRRPIAASVCAVFAPEDVAMWNLYDDMKKFYECGPGEPLAWQIACPLARDIFQGLAAKAADPAGVPVKASFRFAHAETLIPLMAFLQLDAGGPPLTQGMPAAQADARSWRTARLATMAVNLRFVLHRCAAGGAPPTFKVELLHSERQVPWPRCGDRTNVPFCAPEDLLAAYPLAAACPFDSLCA